jgi:hypothetical protein
LLRTFGLGIALVLLTSLWSPSMAACSNRDFCTGWRAVCYRTLPVGGNPDECSRRYAECIKSGCYFFNVPRARCKNNAEDLALTLSCQPPPRGPAQLPACNGVTCSGSLRNCLESRARGLVLNCERDAATCRSTGVWPPNKYMAGAFAKGCRATRD